jgi:hypothetical protein
MTELSINYVKKHLFMELKYESVDVDKYMNYSIYFPEYNLSSILYDIN